jgi:polyisoprenoid-binding protein YceI
MPGWPVAALLSAVAAATAAVAPASPPAVPTTAPVPMPLIFDPTTSHASFKVRLRIMRPGIGNFLDVRGELQPEGTKQRVAVEIDGRRLRFAGPAWMERVTRSSDFLDVEAHPHIRFRSAPFAPKLLRDGGELTGELTLRGQTRPVAFRVLPAACERPGRDCEIQVNGRVSRLAFGMTAYRMTVRDAVDFEFRVKLMPDATP